METHATLCALVCLIATAVVQGLILLPKEGLLYNSLNHQCEKNIPNSELFGLRWMQVSCVCKVGYHPSEDHTRCKPFHVDYCKNDESCHMKHTENSRCGESQTCECNEGYVMSISSEKCFPITSCTIDSECNVGNNNLSSFCNKYGQCECEEKCSGDHQCYMKHGKNSHCSPEESVCDCDEGYAMNSTTFTCQKKITDSVMSSCSGDAICWVRHGMFSHCGPDHHCACNAGHSTSRLLHICLSNSISMFRMEHKECDDDTHCSWKYGMYSECNDDNKCHCLTGYKRSGFPEKCVLENAINTEAPFSPCRISSDCLYQYGESSICQNRQCSCDDGSTYSEDHGICMYDQDFKNCRTDQYCEHRFDINSFCNSQELCACKDRYMEQEAIPRCVAKPLMCNEDVDCKLENSYCHSHNTCVCKEGHNMSADKTYCYVATDLEIRMAKTMSKTSMISCAIIIVLILIVGCTALYCLRVRHSKQMDQKLVNSGSETANFATNNAYYSESDEKPLNA